MLAQHFGSSRSSLKSDHLLQAPDSFIRAPLPGMVKATAIVHAGPAVGARFTEYSVEMEAGGKLGPTSAQRFLYVVDGQVEANGEALAAGGYAFVPQGVSSNVTSVQPARLVVIEKEFQPLNDIIPKAFIGNVGKVQSQALLGDESLQVQALIPDGPEYDFAVNLLTFQPGASLPLVEMHIMEHGLMMLEGGGIYKLGDHWYPVMAGDFIWMAPYCPQWFGAIGKSPAKYLIYKDWNRHPL